MLGITVADAMVLGALLASIAATVLGVRRGEAARTTSPPDPTLSIVGAGLADTAAIKDLAQAIRDLALMQRTLADEKKKEQADHVTDTLSDIQRQLAELDERHPREPTPRKRR
jgi:gas vesicle protein